MVALHQFVKSRHAQYKLCVQIYDGSSVLIICTVWYELNRVNGTRKFACYNYVSTSEECPL